MRLTPSNQRKQVLAFALFSVMLTFGGLAAGSSPKPAGKRKVEFTFAFFGCNRIDAKDFERTRYENPSSANAPQLARNLADIAQLAPDALFFGGDLVSGYANDKGETLRSQTSAWIELVESLPRSPKTEYIAIAGNHELNRKIGEVRLPSPAMDAIWSSLVKSAGLIPAGARGATPRNSPEDSLVSDQRALSFSFNRRGVHFVVLNTDTRVSLIDPQTGETKIGMIPVRWLEKDLAAAQKNPRVKCIVVMGHRNLVDPASAKGEAPIALDCAGRMIATLTAHSKVRAYVCAHVHAFDITTIGASGLKQATFGNGGSKLEKNWNPPRGRTFGFGYFRVYSDGSLGIIPCLRPEPKDYMESDEKKTPPAEPEAELLIPAR